MFAICWIDTRVVHFDNQLAGCNLFVVDVFPNLDLSSSLTYRALLAVRVMV